MLNTFSLFYIHALIIAAVAQLIYLLISAALSSDRNNHQIPDDETQALTVCEFCFVLSVNLHLLIVIFSACFQESW